MYSGLKPTFKYFNLLVMMLFMSPLAHANQQLDQSLAGFYGKDKYCATVSNQYCENTSKKYLVRVRNNVFMLVDNKNKINFKIDFNNPNEQVVSTEYIDFLASRSGAVDGFLNSLTVSNHRILADGKEIDFDFNFNFKFESLFGHFNGALALHINAKTSNNCKERYNSGVDGDVPCLDITSRGIRFTKAETSLSDSGTQAIGLSLDFIFRFFSIFANPLDDVNLFKKQ